MARIKNLVRNKHEGKIVVSEGIIGEIVSIAVSEMPYVQFPSALKHDDYNTNSVKVRVEKDGVYVDVYVIIHYTQSVSETAFKIQEVVRHNVEAMTEYHIAGVNVVVKGVSFDELPAEVKNDSNAKPEDKPAETEKTTVANEQAEIKEETK